MASNPNAAIVSAMEVPPEEISGSGIPVIGSRPTT